MSDPTPSPTQDPQQNATPAAAPVTNKRTSATGSIPKEMKSWALIIVAALIMLAVWFSGSPAKTAKPAAGATDIHQQSVNGLTPEDVQQRLKLADDNRQADLRAAQGLPNGVLPHGSDPLTGSDAAFVQANTPQPPTPPRDTIQEEERKREYLGRFASNIALSYRTDSSQRTATTRQSQTQALSESQSPQDLDALATQLAPGGPLEQKLQQQIQALEKQQQVLTQQQANASSSLASGPSPIPAGSQAQSAQTAPAPSSPSPSKNALNLNAYTGKTRVIFEGTVLESVLVNRLNGDFTGPVLCQVTTDLYSHDHSTILVPAGSRLLGEAKKVADIGQTRLAVVFHRLIMPDGYSVDLDQAPGLNQIGETALHDQVNNHYFKIFGTSIAVGAIAGLASIGTTNNAATGLPASSTDAYRQGVTSSLSQSSLRILDKFLNILPTITIREGHRVRVYLTQDLMVPSYAQHKMPADL